MSDNENEDYIQDVGILAQEEDEYESEKNYIVKDMKNNIIEKNGLLTGKDNEKVMNIIIENIEKFGFNNDELIAEIEKCVTNKIVDISLVETISEFASQFISDEKIEILKSFYKFISDPEFDVNQNEKIRKEIPIILNKFKESKNKLSFRDILIKIKIEIIINILDITDENIKDVITKCLEKNWSLTAIKIFQIKLKVLTSKDEKGITDEKELEKIKIENEQKRHIIESLLNTITAFPMDKTMLDLESIDFTNEKNKETIARDFYLKCSTTCDAPKKELNLDELLIELNNKNLNYFSKEKIAQFKHQIIKAKDTPKPEDYNEWIESFKSYDFKSENKNDYIAEALGVISYALKEKKKFPLRTAQLLAIFIFIDNNENQEDDDEEPENEILIEDENIKLKDDKGKGIIEQISTGEGKTAIISCLAAFYGLRNHKVDIITSSRTLAVRDSSEFKEFYQTFNLIVDFVNGYRPAPYKADITYGTFLDYEGDLLDEISSNKSIRGDRPYDIIIIDEVDNAFIDCIQGSTQLTHSSKGYQFLLPLYVAIYLMMDLLDKMYLEQAFKKYEEIMAKEEYKNLDENSKRNIYEQISDIYERKDAFINYAKKFFEDLKKDMLAKDPNAADDLEKEEGIFEDLQAPDELKNYLIAPEFLDDFIEAQLENWINSAFCAINVYKKEIDYTISSKGYDGYKNITPIDRKNTGELELNTVYKNGLHQMLQIKEELRVKSETLTHTFLSHVSFFIKYKKKNFFGLTGTIGGNETHKIYNNEYFKSNLVFMPSYMAKRFIELPAIICDFNVHMKKICDEISYHFSKGRKILVICRDINEGYQLKKQLEDFSKKDPTIINNIFTYLRNDTDDQEQLNKTNKRIIISTNLGGRGTDIKTTQEQEKNGGLHVIITKLSSNSRTQEQAFGRTSRKGNKGSGQFILTKKKLSQSYNQLINTSFK